VSSLDIDLSTIPQFVTGSDGDSEVAAQRFVDLVAKKLRPEGAGVLSAVMPPPVWLAGPSLLTFGWCRATLTRVMVHRRLRNSPLRA
jgi:hypothetical protein